MKKHSFVRGTAVMLVCALALTGCGGRAKAVSVAELAAYLAKLPANTDTTPATVGIANANIQAEWGKIYSIVKEGGRYVILDLSSCIANSNVIAGSESGGFIKNNKLIKGVILPATLTSIGVWAFSECNSLASVTIPDSVTSIGFFAFYGCSSLTSVTIPATANLSPKDISFSSKIVWTVTGSGGNWTTLENGVLLIYNGDTLVYGRAASGSITIPGSVTSIGNGAFAGCGSLTSITLPTGLTSIGKWAFSSCESLTSVTIPEGLTSIGYQAFYECESLTSVTFQGGSIAEFGYDAFPLNNDLLTAYWAGRAGTYTRSGDTWTKQ
jgi:hypothetical protein